ncbi:hypothetical protein ABZ800_29095 [Streptomyces sp. NPDC047813]|uniref:hypothetical protein n=1 Tax=Streptomyces sp. NPDC047813 TaxID=3154608 RepID=UPI0033F9327E
MSGEPVDVPLEATGCTAVFAVVPRDGGRLSDTACLTPLDGQAEVLEVIGFDAYRTGPGETVAPGQAVARFILRAGNRRAAVGRAEELLGRLEETLGVRLMTGDLDA